ncbi:hypothetical protein PUR71_15230 [Streptomyces sp. SP17BM10]|uniref:hypothetical protein n=1 Tax=Streptomyces sp. SP17BM10 TaxID=3002530 RepID=UPI002E759FFD|nr:hypothetical protein [Streptomyces sp. SP17BM10]MEE1784240.1 hypothetical protein [Streptomyces sp. SP17BM10]
MATTATDGAATDGGPTGGRVLAVVERGYRGALDQQFFDGLHLVTEPHGRLGGLDVLLRGSAAGYALDAAPPPLRIGNRTVDTLTNPRQGLRTLLGAGVRVLVEEPDIAALRSPLPLVDGVELTPAGATAARWGEYRMVVFL